MLKEINIDELETGMFVHEITQQQGNLKIKTRGRVTSDKIIEKLRQQGIVTLVIDLSKALEDSTAKPAEAKAPEAPADEEPKVAFEEEIGRAQQINAQGKKLQKLMLNAVAKGLPVDISIPVAFTSKLVESIDRNPNALLCLTKIREKDSYLLEHSLNVAVLMANFAKYVGMADKEMKELAFAGFLHDIGKIKVPDKILHKPGKLTDKEFVVMRDHVNLGLQVLQDIKGIPGHIIRTVAEHHERLDGKGYPLGKSGDDISLYGRMIAIVDSYDAITANRCYKAGCASDRAFKILMKDSPEKYDKKLVTAFISCMGIYPVGTLVLLSNGQIAMVISQKTANLATPVVKVFYSTANRHYLEPKEVDLSIPGRQIKIDRAVTAEEFKLDFNRFFNESIAA